MNRHFGTIARSFALTMLVLTLVVLATSCTPTDPPTVTLALTPSQIAVGQTCTATVTVRSSGLPVAGANALIATSPTTVATPADSSDTTNSAGVAEVTLTGVGVGTATVNSTCLGEASEPATLTVVAAD
jgi:hypothetical protein